MAKLCFGCMSQKSQSPVCEYCGFDERTENQSHQLPIGTILQNQYLVGRVLGQGGFGITYIGWDQHLSIPVAIKEYFPGGVVQRHTQLGNQVICVNGEAPEIFYKHRERFLKEARTLAQLSGIPEIVQIKSFFPENGTAYIVMEYVEGITLKDHLKRLGRSMTEEEALIIMEPVLKALQKVHDHGLIHRDISPDNIMLPINGGIKLIDFGTVRYLDDSGKSKSTEAVLKPGFAPMEQYNTHGNIGPWTDVYALCATFHYLLTGKVPADVHARLDQGESLNLLRNRKDISQKMISVLEKGMKIRYQERVQTIGELYQHLYAGKKKTAVKKQQEGKTEKKTKKKGKGSLLVACTAAVVAVGAAMLLIPKEQKTEQSVFVPETTAGVTQSTDAPETAIPETAASETAEPITPESLAYAEAEQLLESGETARAAIAFGKLAGYKDARKRSIALWQTMPRKTLDITNSGVIGLTKTGEVVIAFNDQWAYADQQETRNIISGWTDIVSVSNGNGFWYGLKCDGTVVSVGDDRVSAWQGILRLPEDDSFGAVDVHGKIIGMGGTNDNEQKIMDGWSDVTMCGNERCIRVALLADGTAVSTGVCGYCKAGNLWGWSDLVAICAADHTTIGLKADGTILRSGYGDGNQLDVKYWKDIVAVSTSGTHTVGLKSDGTVMAAGYNGNGKCDVSGWRDVVAIDVGGNCTAGLRVDGTVLYAGPEDAVPIGFLDWTDIQNPAVSIQTPENQMDAAAAYAEAERLLANGETARAAIAFGKLGDYSDARERSFALWRTIFPNQTISAGTGGAAVVKQDGSVLHITATDSRQNAAVNWRDIVSVSVGYSTTVGLKSDGIVVSLGTYDVNSWTNMVAVDASQTNVMGLKADGTVSVTGHNVDGICEDWKDIVAISASSHLVGLKMDGTVVAVGSNQNGQCDVSQWKDIVAIASDSYNSRGITIGLKADGTVELAGIQYDLSGWTDIVAVAAGVDQQDYFVAGICADGRILTAGSGDIVKQISSLESFLKGHSVAAISASGSDFMVLRDDGKLRTIGERAFIYQGAQFQDVMLPTTKPLKK